MVIVYEKEWLVWSGIVAAVEDATVPVGCVAFCTKAMVVLDGSIPHDSMPQEDEGEATGEAPEESWRYSEQPRCSVTRIQPHS